MKTTIAILALYSAVSHAEEIHLFNGKDLSGWEGLNAFWSVEDGAITAKSTAENPIDQNTFLIWKEGEVSDFTLSFKYKLTPCDDKNFANSGVQYRSNVINTEKFIVGGYQADFEYGDTYSGILYEERGREILANRGQRVVIKQGAEPTKPNIEIVGQTGNSETIQAAINRDDWNLYKIVAEGNHVRHYINGNLTIDVTDETAEAPKKGVLALQMHAGPPMQVQFKDLILITK